MNTPIDALLGIGGKLIDRLWPDPAQRDAAKLKLLEMNQAGDLAEMNADLEIALAQAVTNQKAAESGSIFVSGARPFIMWVCGFALAYAYILQPFLIFGATIFMESPPEFPTLEMGDLMPILLGILGLGGYRTFEKKNGVARAAL